MPVDKDKQEGAVLFSIPLGIHPWDIVFSARVTKEKQKLAGGTTGKNQDSPDGKIIKVHHSLCCVGSRSSKQKAGASLKAKLCRKRVQILSA